MFPKFFCGLGPVGNEIFFYIITYIFNIVKPVGPQFTGKGLVSGETSPYDGLLEVAKKSHMVGPVGNTELGGRWRRVHHIRSAYEA